MSPRALPEDELRDFVAESNRIEGIHGLPSVDDVRAHVALLSEPELTIEVVATFVRAVGGAPLRNRLGMDVRVGPHLPPRGGVAVEASLRQTLADINAGLRTPFEAHCAYEELHPFMDGNGRSGRAIWAWHMLSVGKDPLALPFLHRWYYDSLDYIRQVPDES
jgi:hypothetical protein